MLQFYNKTVVELLVNSTAHEDQMDAQQPLGKRNEIDNSEPIFLASTQSFPINDYMAKAMFSILGKDGILEATGFHREGFILPDGTASVRCHRSFGNRTKLLTELYQAHRVSLDGGGGVAVAVQLLLSHQDFQKMVDWLKVQIQLKGDLNYENPCSPSLVIWFECCMENGSVFFSPKFGSLNFGVD